MTIRIRKDSPSAVVRGYTVDSLYGAKILSIARNRSGRLPVMIMDDTTQDISSTNRSGCGTFLAE